MKVSALTKMMNDHGTKPRVQIFKRTDDCRLLVYEGSPMNIDEEIGRLKVNSFTALAKGYIVIYAQ